MSPNLGRALRGRVVVGEREAGVHRVDAERVAAAGDVVGQLVEVGAECGGRAGELGRRERREHEGVLARAHRAGATAGGCDVRGARGHAQPRDEPD